MNDLSQSSISAPHQLPIDFNAAAHYIRYMKTLKATLCIALLALIAVGCGGVEKILPKQDGTWTTTFSEFKFYVNSTLDTTITVTAPITYVFDKSGSATATDANGTKTITWSVNPEGDLVTLCSNSIGAQDCEQFVVQSSDKDAQDWKSQKAGTANGMWTDHHLKLARVK